MDRLGDGEGWGGEVEQGKMLQEVIHWRLELWSSVVRVMMMKFLAYTTRYTSIVALSRGGPTDTQRVYPSPNSLTPAQQERTVREIMHMFL